MATKKAVPGPKALFRVRSPIKHDGESYGVDDEVELTQAQAEALGTEHVTPAPAAKAE